MRQHLYICVFLILTVAKEVIPTPTTLININTEHMECGPSFVVSLNSSQREKTCLPRVNIGESCQEDTQCPGPGFPERTSVCETVCGCENGYIHIGVENCLKVLDKIGDSCEASEQCQTGKPGYLSECVQLPGANVTTCQCQPGSVHRMISANSYTYNHVCLRIAKEVGESCFVQEQCIPNLINGICVSDTCKCARNTTSYPGLPCLPDVGFAERCEHSGQCNNIPHAACINETCLCDVGYTEFGSKTCVETKYVVGQSCVMDEQCEIDANRRGICDANRMCQCPDNKTFMGDDCYKPALDGEKCNTDKECQANDPISTCQIPGHKCGVQDQNSNNATKPLLTILGPSLIFSLIVSKYNLVCS